MKAIQVGTLTVAALVMALGGRHEAAADGGYGHPPAPHPGYDHHQPHVDNVHYNYYHAPHDYHGSAHVNVDKHPGGFKYEVNVDKHPGGFKYEVKEEGKSRPSHGYPHPHGGPGPYHHGPPPPY
ncbi:unnamed protein product [Notodromas monacha]|uniref:Uncharacterized protein n=1 Tax=Notodromas monacha TaxID=399045 RepID=A0A7R9BX03_9CRUS|nr:unnamed protein product [Notodromas monacha]CAG0921763.1 unnamed protein product [Notodromas monacha]